MKSKKIAALIPLTCAFLFYSQYVIAQAPDSIYADNIKTVQLYNYGNQFSLPVINLNSGDRLELHFDDIDTAVTYYYYTY